MPVSYVDVPAAAINLCMMLYSGFISSGAPTSPASIWSAVILDPYSCRFNFSSTVIRPPVQAEQSVVESSNIWLTYLAQDHKGHIRSKDTPSPAGSASDTLAEAEALLHALLTFDRYIQQSPISHTVRYCLCL